MRKSFYKITLILCLFLSMLIGVNGSDDSFYVEEIKSDGSTEILDQTESYTVAKASYDAHVANVNNIQIRQGETIWKMKYGVVLFQTSKTCDYNVTYLSENGNGYTNGCYGIDAAYVGSSNSGYLDFYISGIYGSTTADDVTLLPIETAKQVSSYLVDEGKLYHQIKTNMKQQTYSGIVYLGEAPDYLKEGAEYYSYDGHYFYPASEDYSGFHRMIDDLQAETHTHAINAAAPFYQYFQYLSHRSETSYGEKELDSYFSDYLQIKGPLRGYRSNQTSYHAILTQSLLKGSAPAFLQYQNEFGANALMMLALSMNETAVGRSYLAYSRNNLFGHAAFDSAVEENASRYHSVEASIYSHAYHYLHEGYADPDNYVWHGGYFGNKASGMNVMYASDPYWGEKAAQYCVKLDEALGGKDINHYPLGIIKGGHNVSFYKEPDDTSDKLYTTSGLTDFAVILLKDTDDYYQIQSEQTVTKGHGYRFDRNIAYVKKSDIDIVSQPIKTEDTKRYIISFDAQDGEFENQTNELKLSLKEGQIPSVIPPIKQGWLFTGWNKEIQPVSNNDTYTARYEKITKVSLAKQPKLSYELEEQVDVSGGILQIELENGENKQIPLNSSMISAFDNEKSGKQTIQVTYQGASCEYEIEFHAAEKEQKSDITAQAEALLKKLDSDQPIDDATKEQLLKLKTKMDQQGIADFNIDGYRRFDAALQKAYGSSLRTLVHDDDSKLSVSGLSVAVPLDEPSYFPQTIHFSFRKDVDDEAEALLKKVAEGNGYTSDYYFRVNVKHGSDPIKLQESLIYALPIENDTKINRHYMVLAYENGEVIQIPAEQASNQIRFLSKHIGDFALVYRSTSNTYQTDNQIENNSAATNPFSLWDYLIWIIGALTILSLIVFGVIFRSRRRKGKRGNKPIEKPKAKQKRKRKDRKKRKEINKSESTQPPQVEAVHEIDEQEDEEELIHYFRN